MFGRREKTKVGSEGPSMQETEDPPPPKSRRKCPSTSQVEPSRQSAKRPGYIDWDEYFMAIAQISAHRSKDPITQVGACIVNKNKRIVGIGYNGFSDKMEENDDVFSWERDKKKLFVCHAEMNAIMNKSAVDLTGCTIYSTLHPCNECAKLIAQSRIEKVYYKEFPDDKRKKPEFKAGEEMLRAAKIDCIQLEKSERKPLEIDLYKRKEEQEMSNT